jgi:hypothetical protein
MLMFSNEASVKDEGCRKKAFLYGKKGGIFRKSPDWPNFCLKPSGFGSLWITVSARSPEMQEVASRKIGRTHKASSHPHLSDKRTTQRFRSTKSKDDDEGDIGQKGR